MHSIIVFLCNRIVRKREWMLNKDEISWIKQHLQTSIMMLELPSIKVKSFTFCDFGLFKWIEMCLSIDKITHKNIYIREYGKKTFAIANYYVSFFEIFDNFFITFINEPIVKFITWLFLSVTMITMICTHFRGG